MSEVRLVLSSEDYVTLYSQLAERRMQAFQDADKRRYSQWGETPVIVEDDQGNTSFSDWAQDEFDDECGIIEDILANMGIVQENV